jgi:hypothetical protein
MTVSAQKPTSMPTIALSVIPEFTIQPLVFAGEHRLHVREDFRWFWGTA